MSFKLTNPNNSIVHICVPQVNLNFKLAEGQSTTLTNLQAVEVKPFVIDFKLILEDNRVIEARAKEEAELKAAADKKLADEAASKKLEDEKKAAEVKKLADDKAKLEADKKAAEVAKLEAEKKLADEKAAADAKAKSEENK